MIAKCTECASEFKVELKTVTVARGTQKTFFTCPECNHEYVAFVKNGKILNEQARIKRMYSEMRLRGVSYEEQMKMMLAIEKAETAVKRDMDALKKRYS